MFSKIRKSSCPCLRYSMKIVNNIVSSSEEILWYLLELDQYWGETKGMGLSFKEAIWSDYYNVGLGNIIVNFWVWRKEMLLLRDTKRAFLIKFISLMLDRVDFHYYVEMRSKDGFVGTFEDISGSVSLNVNIKLAYCIVTLMDESTACYHTSLLIFLSIA